MEYRRLGRSGLKVSVFGFGSWVTFGGQLDRDGAIELLQAAYEAGVNLFDNAEGYGSGQAERLMGEAIAELGWPRHRYVVTSKYFWGLDDRPNSSHTLNRGYLLPAIAGSLERFGLDHLDIIYCHRPDPHTPIEETVRAMSDAIERGYAHYWGTSQWPAESIRAAWELAERHHLHKPVVEQPQYNLLHRDRVEREYRRSIEDLGLGLTTWSPLGYGLLSGKYLDRTPPGSRATLAVNDWMPGVLTDPARNAIVRATKEQVADPLRCSLAQLALAWCARNPAVSSVLIGASSLAQLQENLGALQLIPQLSDEVLAQLDELTQGDPALVIPAR